MMFESDLKKNKKDAFFSCLPEYAQLYAIPYSLSKKNFKKHGRQSGVHQKALQKIKDFEKIKNRSIITIFIGESTNIVAVKNGNPIEFSDGFSEAGGILSATGCGDIDSTIVFQLMADGVSVSEVENLLSTQSGFKALAGVHSRLKDVFSRKDPRAKFAKQVFCYQLLKYVGAYVAILGGLDFILFIGENQKENKSLVFELMRQLKLLDIKRKSNIAWEDVSLLTANDSSVKCYFLQSDKI
ncbi:MAG: hypothetical protein PHY73_06440 [Candidatus Omnitrophica bacterium]|nr:hypothetical protein [Candidatus Omnitrophota bacterium]